MYKLSFRVRPNRNLPTVSVAILEARFTHVFPYIIITLDTLVSEIKPQIMV
jgi:hypothetical protein